MTSDGPFSGTLSETPFARVLFDLWRQEKTGGLRLIRAGSARTLFFEKGQAVVARDLVAESDFLAALVRKKVLEPDQAREIELYAELQEISLVKSIGDLDFLGGLAMWNLLESYFLRQVFPLFELVEGEFAFEPGAAPPPGGRFGIVATPDLLLQGIRRMKNTALISRRLPPENDPIQVLCPYYASSLSFEPHERYALHVLGQSATIKQFQARSELGSKDCLRVLYALHCLGLLVPADRPAKAAPAGETSGTDQARVLEALNEKCAYVFRYVTKEIGPVGQSILGRALEEIRPGLGPLFQKMEMRPDGRIEVDRAVRQSASHLPEELFRGLVRGYDEILMAEVLAVKKTLGKAHEAGLVHGLEKVGCP